jgi:hypothetical protein
MYLARDITASDPDSRIRGTTLVAVEKLSR